MSGLEREMLAAGAGCAIGNGSLNCLETTKVKLQLLSRSQSGAGARCALTSGSNTAAATMVYQKPTTVGIMSQIASEEGVVRGLMLPGLGASLTRACLYGAYRVGLYSVVRDYQVGSRSNKNGSTYNAAVPTLNDRILSGMITGGIGSMISCPLDVIRTRLQADAGKICPDRNTHYVTGLRRGQPVRYRGMWSALWAIYQQEGLRQGLYRGASVTVTRASLLNGAQLASYDTLKHTLLLAASTSDNNHVVVHEGPVLHVFCALLSGIIAQTVVMPIDTVKAHLMLGKGWKSVLDQIRQHHYSPVWFYRGYLPACAGQGLVMVLQMPLIEEFRRYLGVRPI